MDWEDLFKPPSRMRELTPLSNQWIDDMIWPGGDGDDPRGREICIKTEMAQGVPNKLWDTGKDEY